MTKKYGPASRDCHLSLGEGSGSFPERMTIEPSLEG